MTFIILGTCERTGKVGFAQTTSTGAIGGRRTARAMPGIGAFTIQAYGSAPVADLIERLIRLGYGARKVIEEACDSDRFREWRQIAVVRPGGDIACYTGGKAVPWAGHVHGKNFATAGNVLVGAGVVDAMAKAFESAADAELEERLMRGIEAGRDAGGQPDGQTSAVIHVFHAHSYPIVDLRVDMHSEPVGELRRIFDWYKPLIPYYVARTNDPSSVPRYKQWLREQGLPLNPFGQAG
jgi:uncharacterized Ntn-hydrolase superfamily protein